MSLLALSQQKNREHDEMFLSQTEELAASEGPPEPQDLVGRHEAMIRRQERREEAALAAGGAPPVTEADASSDIDVVIDEDEPVETARDVSEQVSPAAPLSEASDPVETPAPPAEKGQARQRPVTAEGDPAPAAADQQGYPIPEGIPEGSRGVPFSDEDRVAALAAEKIRGSISDGGSVEDLLAGLPPRPSVASQREIREFNRRRLGVLEVQRPANWPEFMTFPTDTELRALRREGVTPEMIQAFEADKQRQADAMEARARELNEWIFSYGDMRLNEKHQMARSRNRDEAVRKRSEPMSRNDADLQKPGPADVTDEELYKDRHYGIRFAMLLNPDPDHLNKLRTAPVAAWGHDRLRTLDGGQIRATGDELVVTTVSLQAAQMLVMEAKSRGWETLRISGDNEFCAAVKRACKEQGMGAIITRRGPLGLGPFSRPEVIMPPLPNSLSSREASPSEQERSKREAAAPRSDRDAADALLGEGAHEDPKPGKGADTVDLAGVAVTNPISPEDRAEPVAETPDLR